VETRTQGSDPAPQQLIRYQLSNHLGSASLELDDQAQIISYEEFYPYGSTSYQAVSSQTETPKRYRYTGKERDEESGLYYHGARYFVPWLCRWNSCDPAGLVDGPNLYQYVGSNPIRRFDPSGMQRLEQGTQDDPVVAGCVAGVCYLNIRQSRLRELQQRAAVQQRLETGEAIANNPFSALFWLISTLFTDDPNKQHAAAQLGLATFGVAEAAAGTQAGRQQMQSVAPAQPQRPIAAEVRAANPPATQTTPPQAPGASPPPPPAAQAPPAAEPLPAAQGPPAGGPAATAPRGVPAPPRLINLSTPGERYLVQDPASPRFYAEGTVSSHGELSISIRTVLETGQRSTLLTGAEQFQNIVRFFRGQFTSIKGNWQFGSNLARFNELTAQGLSAEEAAARTWTGQQAAAAGFKTVKVQNLQGTPGKYTSVQVLFTE
jgi:RHS repeat-associated protein